jgi:hypothetical protein
MLIVKVFVNTEQIDEIQIHNKGPLRGRPDWRRYVVVGHPELENFYHIREDGYKPLLAQVLARLIEEEQES